jgi:hypothetical protein
MVNAGRAPMNADRAPVNAGRVPDDDDGATVDTGRVPSKTQFFSKESRQYAMILKPFPIYLLSRLA